MLTNGDSSSGAADREAGSPQRHKPTSRRGETSPGAEPAGSCWHRTAAPFEAAAQWIQQCLAPRDLMATPRMLRRRRGQMGPDQYEYEQRCLRRVRLLLLVAAVMAVAGAATSMAIPYVPGALFFVGMTGPLLLILRASASREDDRLPTGSEDEVSPDRLLWATRACLFLPLVVLIDYVVRAESVDVDSVTEKDGWLETEVGRHTAWAGAAAHPLRRPPHLSQGRDSRQAKVEIPAWPTEVQTAFHSTKSRRVTRCVCIHRSRYYS
eukprot:scaffold15945_cov106-Isochrysis_galbana.AAC.4